MIYKPDNFLIIKLERNDTKLYKVLAGWSESYLYGSSWKLNSGITQYRVNGNIIDFEGYSGSVYSVHKLSERNSMATSSVITKILGIEGCSLISFEQFQKEFIPEATVV